MESRRVRAVGALSICLSLGLSVVGAATSTASTSTPSAKPKAQSHAPGFYVATTTGVTRVTSSTNPAAFVSDGDGTNHVVTTVKSSVPGKGHYDYLTQRPGHPKWVSHLIPGLVPTAGKIGVEAHVSDYGDRVFVVFYECDGVFVADAPITASSLPEPTQVVSAATCSGPTPTSNRPSGALAFSTGSRSLDILLPDPAQGGANALYAGQPGGTFTPGPAIPAADNFVPKQAIFNGRYRVVGTSTDGANRGIYMLSLSPYGTPAWTAPTLVATLKSPTKDYTIDSVAGYYNTTFVGLSLPHHRGHTLFIDKQSNTGQWSGVLPVPNTNVHDSSLRLLVNTKTNHLHAVWTRVVPGAGVTKSGIMHEARKPVGWYKPTFLSHWYKDKAAEFALSGTQNLPVIGFEQR